MAREVCTQCYRPQSVCYCSVVNLIENELPIRIVQHKLEQFQAKGTARLAELCLANCNIEIVDPKLETWCLAENDVVLFPALEATPLSDTHAVALKNKATRFVIIDGTWRQANQLLRACSNIESAEYVVLNNNTETQYACLRKTKKTGSLSTFEAITALIACMSSSNKQISHLKQTFTDFLNFQLAIQKNNKYE